MAGATVEEDEDEENDAAFSDADSINEELNSASKVGLLLSSFRNCIEIDSYKTRHSDRFVASIWAPVYARSSFTIVPDKSKKHSWKIFARQK